jgi:hypothetical protein
MLRIVVLAGAIVEGVLWRLVGLGWPLSLPSPRKRGEGDAPSRGFTQGGARFSLTLGYYQVVPNGILGRVRFEARYLGSRVGEYLVNNFWEGVSMDDTPGVVGYLDKCTVV